MSEGKLFIIHAPSTGTVQRPTVESLTARTHSLLDRYVMIVAFLGNSWASSF